MVAILGYRLGVQRGPDGREYEIIQGSTDAVANTRTAHTISQAKPVYRVTPLSWCLGTGTFGGGTGFNSGATGALCPPPVFPPQYFEHDATDAGPPVRPAPTISSFAENVSVDFVAEVVYGGEGYAGGSSV